MTGNTMRMGAAALLAPLSILIAAPAGAVLAGIAKGALTDILGEVRFAETLLFFAYPAMFILGLPVYLLLRHWRLVTLWSAMVTGLMGPFVVQLLMQLEMAWERARSGVPFDIAYRNVWWILSHPLVQFDWLNFLSLVVAVSFWWIAGPASIRQDATS